MEDLRKTYGKKNALILLSLFVLLMIVGSFADYPFSQMMYNQENFFGIFFAAFGEAPAMLGLLSAGMLLILGRNKDRKSVAVFQCVAGALLLLVGAAGTIYMPSAYMKSPILAYAIGTVFAAVTLFLIVRMAKSADRETMVKVALTFFLVVVLEMVIINVIKIPWGRPRMRMLVTQPEAYFTNWWVAGTELRDKLVALGVDKEEFKSFPSGHTANGAAAMLLPLLALLSRKLKGKETLLLFIGAVWGLLVALSRVIMGAHFITDTAVGFAITLAVIWIVVALVFKKKKAA